LNLKGKKVTVVGMARSGIACAAFLKAKGALVTVTDSKPEDELLKQKTALLEIGGIEIEFSGHSEKALFGAELLVVSPGVNTKAPVFSLAEKKGVEIIGELELAALFMCAPVVAVTGTKGKTTTTTLIGEILKRAGKKTVVGGNIGKPLTNFLLSGELLDEKAFCVAEVSSFQLETINTFRPAIAAILNIGSDHMDRYQNLQQYIEAKGNIFKNQSAAEILILNENDKYTPLYETLAKSKIYYFDSISSLTGGKEGAYLEGEIIVLCIKGETTRLMNYKELSIKGMHNAENAMVAALAAKLAGAAASDIVPVLREFKGVEHRQEFAGEINGVKFINNSQGTNMLAVEKSIQSYDAPIILIAGGRNKNSDFKLLETSVAKKVKRIVAIGEARAEIKKALNNSAPVEEAGTMDEAVKKAYEFAASGDIVLMSPGCTSFDMFKDYEERGRVFKTAVLHLKEAEKETQKV